ncbi:carboxypeptidase regulatory-like domain-containing protein [Streptomyces massasporeus]|uniref:carboxypeptidase regulatory-like domain-containing protein n=1 Tax=Streptomyces massasporeus TaxID=67324 RepID=UPI00345587BD
MNRYSRTAAVVGGVVVGALVVPGASAVARDGGLWGAATIAPGREGIVEVAGVPEGAEGVMLTLTAPRGTRVTGAPLDAFGYRGSVAADGRSAAYTVTGGVSGHNGVLPFVLAVPGNAVPGTRLRDCSLRLTDARGVPRAVGRCSVTVGLASPTLTRPLSGVPLGARPEVSGTAHPGAQVTVHDKDDQEACATTAAPDGTWSCAPGTALPAGANRLQAVAALNGVSAMSEQIDIVVAEAGAGRQ